MDLFHISLWYIEGLCLGVLGILWYLVVLGMLRVLSLNLPCVSGLERIPLLCILCLSVCVGLLELFLVLTIPIFFCILANWIVWCPSALPWFWCCCTGGWLICSWGSIFIGSLGFVAAAALLLGEIGQSFLRSKRFQDIFLP